MAGEDKNIEKIKFKNAVFYPTVLCFLIVLLFVFEKTARLNFSIFGIAPREIKGLFGIIAMPFLHSNIEHLLHNIVSLFVLMLALFYFYRGVALKSFMLMWFFSGLLLWLIGRESYHIGASGLIYALAFFLFFSGIFRRHVPLASVSAIIVFLYGSFVWGALPWQPKPEISWEGHFSGLLVGMIFAIILRKRGPQKIEKVWEDEPSDENPYWLDQ
jgi:membrane associated rhomboid family serine protease